MPKRSRVVLLAIVALILVVGVVILDKALDLNFSAALGAVTSLTLVFVTWLYVDSTRNLLEVQKAQSLHDAKQEHYAAAAKLWGVALQAEDTVSNFSLIGPDLSNLTITQAGRETQSDEIEAMADKLGAYSREMVGMIVVLDRKLEEKTWVVATAVMAASTLLYRLSAAILAERLRSLESGDPFDAARVAAEWEGADSDPDHPRWKVLSSADALKPLEKQLSDFAFACKAAVAARTN